MKKNTLLPTFFTPITNNRPTLLGNLGLILVLVLVGFSTQAQHQHSHYFITTWTTATPGETITIPTRGSGYDYEVDWDYDGLTFDNSTAHTGNATSPPYAAAGTHTVAIRSSTAGGNGFPRICFAYHRDKDKITTIEQWGTQTWTSMASAFQGCSNLNYNATDAPDLSSVTDMSYMFSRASSFNGDINNWNTASVTDMSKMFSVAISFNQPLDNWNTASVTHMGDMFQNASSFNQPLNNWNTDSVTDMSYMFSGASSFNQPLNNWNTASVTHMSRMFSVASSFNQPLDNWNTASVTHMSGMFQSANSFNGDINNWNTASVTNMSYMFHSASSFNQPLNSWNTASVKNMLGMFYGASSFNQPLDNWNTASVTDMSYMFSGASSFNQPLDNWNTASVTNMVEMFSRTSSFNQPLDNWNTASVTNMSYMFSRARSFNGDINSWNTASVRDMLGMFLRASSFNQLLDNWNTASVRDMESMFEGATSFNQPLNNWNTASVKNMSYMFFGAASFNQPLNNWNTASVTNMSYMFFGADFFDQSLGSWDVTAVKPNYLYSGMSEMLDSSGLSIANYDATLIGWAEQTVTSGNRLGALNLEYCTAYAARDALIAAGWKITGDAPATLPGTLAIATSAGSVTLPQGSKTHYTSDCSTIFATVEQGGGSPVSGNVDAQVWLDASVIQMDRPYVQRHFEITPAMDASTATGTVTLYFLQSEFDVFNADPSRTSDLPANPDDAEGIVNLRITQFPGTSSDGTGNPSTYGSTPISIDPADADIIWNTVMSCWEVSFSVTGFSGFFVHAESTPLPVIVSDFYGENRGETNTLYWTTDGGVNNSGFEIERRTEGKDFESIGSVSGAGTVVGTQYEFQDQPLENGNYYYRLKQIDTNEYSQVIQLEVVK